MESALGPPVAAVTSTGRHGHWFVVATGPLLVAFVATTHLAALAVAGTAPFRDYVPRFLLYGLIAALSFGALASLLGRARPGNLLGLLAAWIAWGFGVSIGGSVLGAALADPVPGLARWLIWVSMWCWPAGMFAIPTILVLRFPDGRLAHPRVRPLEWLAITGMVIATVHWMVVPYGVIDDAPLGGLDNPVAMPTVAPYLGVGATLVGLAALGCLAVLLGRTLRAEGVERARLQWILVGMAGAVVIVTISVLLGSDAAWLSAIGLSLVPASIAVAVLRHRLWDVQVLIDRSLTYALLTASILVLYATAIEVLGGALGRTTGAPIAATGLVAIAVLPLRDRLQRLVTRLRYGDRGDPRAALARLGSQLEVAGDRGVLLDDVTDAVVRALKLRGAAIVVDGTTLASAGDPGPVDAEVPLSVRGEVVGHLRVSERPHDALSPADTGLLAELARHVAQTVRAERLQAEVERSRVALVSAREEERRRIRHDLHDELGPTLSAAALAVEQVATELGPLPHAQTARLQATADHLRGTVGTVRSLVAGLRPGPLDELGLAGALQELVRQLSSATLTIELDVDEVPPLPAAVDAALYRIVGEALTNVVRHADARCCEVRLRVHGRAVEVVVSDDGCGLSPASAAGLGLTSMRQRAEELGGSFAVSPRRGGGTELRATVPVDVA